MYSSVFLNAHRKKYPKGENSPNLVTLVGVLPGLYVCPFVLSKN
jgi:hypothetical protein